MCLCQVDIDKDIGDIFKIRIVVDQNGKVPVWSLDRIKLKHAETQQEFHFSHYEQIKTSQGLGDAVIELAAIRPDIPPLPGTVIVACIIIIELLSRANGDLRLL